MKNRYSKLACTGMAVLLALSSMPTITARAEEIVTPEEVVAEQPVMEEEVSGTGEVSTGGLQYNKLANGTLEITGYNGNDTEIVVPSEIDGKTVASIGEEAFNDCSNLTSIELPSTVTSIGKYAFLLCGNLANISVDQNNKTYSSLDGVLFNKQKTELIRCPGAKKGQYQVPSGVTNIKNFAFSRCINLTSIELPNGVTSVGNYTFSWCDNLASIKLSNEITNIGISAFEYCINLTSIKLPSGITSIEKYAFSGCEALTSIELPSGITSIENDAFSGCRALTSIELPSGVTSIGDNAFSACKGLTSIELPSGVTSIGRLVFAGCNSLTNISVDKNSKTYSSLDGVLFNKQKTKLVSYPGAKRGTYQVPSGVTNIENYAFSRCSNLTGIEFPSGMTSIGERAFEYCSNLTSIELPSEMKRIGYSAFEDCSNLTSVKLPKGVTYIGNMAFLRCDKLTIICEENSYAYTYAVANKIPFRFIEKYTITFDTNGGAALNQTSLTIKEGETLGELPTPTRTGYTFKGWFTAKTGGTTVIKDTKPTADMTIYAQWEQIKNENESIKPGSTPDKPQQKQSLAKAAVTIAKVSYAYDGKKKTPAVSVTLDGKKLAVNTDYKVTYQKNKNIGTAKVLITGAGNYTGTVTGTFTISAKKGTSFTVGAYKYKITGSKEAAFTGIKSAKTTKVVIPKTVKIGGKTFKVTSVAKKALYKKAKVTSVTIGANVKTIGASAFAGCKKLSTITVNTTKLENVGKKAFQGIKATAKIKVPSKKLKAYKKVLKGKGQGRKVKLVKK